MSKYNNQGYLFPNHREGQVEGSPHYTGKITVGGVEYRLSAWKKPRGDHEMLSLAVRTQEEHQAEQARRKPLPKADDYEYQGPPELPDELPGMEGEIPF